MKGSSRRNFFDAHLSRAREVSRKAAEEKVKRGGSAKGARDAEERAGLLSYVRRSIVGADEAFEGPFGLRRVVYADFVASGRPLSFVEDYIRSQVMPMYANTHTTTSKTGLQSTLFREEARDIVARCVRAGRDDAVVFCGSGATAALNRLVSLTGLRRRADHIEAARAGPQPDWPAVILGPYEHHSNILPWRESICTIHTIREDSTRGGVDLADLEATLKRLRKEGDAGAHGRLIIGSFSAASNVTGILVDTKAVTEILHKYNALSFWDYATAAPYKQIDMNPGGAQGSQGGGGGAAKDAVCLSGHKMLGGPGSPGILVVKRALLARAMQSRPPDVVGGGTVFFVGPTWHRYLQNHEENQEGGTPDIIGAVRAGLAFQLTEAISHDFIADAESKLSKSAGSRLRRHPRIEVLGHDRAARLPIFSIRIRAPSRVTRVDSKGVDAEATLSQKYLHYGFVSALLNDLFGIQARGGCACAGPYAQELLGLPPAKARAVEAELLRKQEIIRPGFVRVCLHYAMSEEEVLFVLSALEFVADNGWAFLPQYHFSVDSGEWSHRKFKTRGPPDRRWLGNVTYSAHGMHYPKVKQRLPESDLPKSIQIAHNMVQEIRSNPIRVVDQSLLLDERAGRLRRFMLPSEAAALLRDAPDGASLAEDKALFSMSNNGVDRGVNPSVKDKRDLKQKESKSKNMGIESLPPRSDAYCPPAATPPPRTPGSPVPEEKSQPGSQLGSEQTTAMEMPSNGQQTARICRNCFHPHSMGVGKGLECLTQGCDCVNYAPLLEGSVPLGAIASTTPPAPESKLDAKWNKSKDQHETAKAKSLRGSRAKRTKKVFTRVTKLVGKASFDFGMIREGDRILVGVSGGKDSLTLLNALRDRQRRSKVKFEVAACTVDPMAPEYDPSPLKTYMASLGVRYFFESHPIMETAKSKMKNNSICAFCSRMRRGVLYSTARREGYNVLALGQHLDDLAESFMMSAFHNGVLRTMKAHYVNDEGDVRIIRPLVYVRERDLRDYAMLAGLPIINENCPACFSEPKERARVKRLLASQEHVHPTIFSGLMRAMVPLMRKGVIVDEPSDAVLAGENAAPLPVRAVASAKDRKRTRARYMKQSWKNTRSTTWDVLVSLSPFIAAPLVAGAPVVCVAQRAVLGLGWALTYLKVGEMGPRNGLKSFLAKVCIGVVGGVAITMATPRRRGV